MSGSGVGLTGGSPELLAAHASAATPAAQEDN